MNNAIRKSNVITYFASNVTDHNYLYLLNEINIVTCDLLLSNTNYIAAICDKHFHQIPEKNFPGKMFLCDSTCHITSPPDDKSFVMKEKKKQKQKQQPCGSYLIFSGASGSLQFDRREDSELMRRQEE